MVLVEHDRALVRLPADGAAASGRTPCIDPPWPWPDAARHHGVELVLLDPPFDAGLDADALAAPLPRWLAGGFVYVELPPGAGCRAVGLRVAPQGRAVRCAFVCFGAGRPLHTAGGEGRLLEANRSLDHHATQDRRVSRHLRSHDPGARGRDAPRGPPVRPDHRGGGGGAPQARDVQLDERLDMAREVVSPYPHVAVERFRGLLRDFVVAHGDAMVRGLRAVTDFDYEFQLAGMNR